MNLLLLASVVLSFIASYFLGKRFKTYWLLFASFPIGILVALPTIFLYVRFGDMERFGLGVIALLPVLIVFASFLNVLSSFLGALTGILRAKRKRPDISSGRE